MPNCFLVGTEISAQRSAFLLSPLYLESHWSHIQFRASQWSGGEIIQSWSSPFCASFLYWISSLISYILAAPNFSLFLSPAGCDFPWELRDPHHAGQSVLEGKAIKRGSQPLWLLSFKGWTTSSFCLILVALQCLQKLYFKDFCPEFIIIMTNMKLSLYVQKAELW